MTSNEFAEWQAYYLLEPFGPQREDQRAGTIASAVVNVHQKKGSRPLDWRDFFPPYVRKAQGWQEQLAIVEMLNAAFGGDDLRQTKSA
jgi:hypothetical protein